MGKLSDDERKLLDELTARASAPDEDDDYEIEIYDTERGRGARMPFRSGKSWLKANLGFDFGEETPPAGSGAENGGTGAGQEGAAGTGTADKRGTYFGRGRQ